jgi:hypothetical protein
VAALVLNAGLSSHLQRHGAAVGRADRLVVARRPADRARAAGLAIGFAGVLAGLGQGQLQARRHGVSPAWASPPASAATLLYGFGANYTRRRG